MLHRWDITPAQAIALQKRLAGLVRVEPLARPVRTVAGVDCAFDADGREILAVAVLCDAETMAVLARSAIRRPCEFPYVPGLLSFREAPAILEAVGRLRPRPDLLMCDGQGLAHPRGVGLACHVGLWLDCPTIGVAKSRLCGEHESPGAERPGQAPLLLEGRTVGAVVRTRSHVRPVYISVGHRITLGEAVAWTLRCGRGLRLPEPTRLADRAVAEFKKELSPG